MSMEDILFPDWPAPPRVQAAITTRRGGCSKAPYDSNNLAAHVGDLAEDVLANRAQLQQQLQLPAEPQWLNQVHGIKVVEAHTDGQVRTADACYSRQAGVVCSVLTADCLPLLVCDRQGSQVAAVHAGWRSLADGVIRETLATFTDPAQCLVYLAPAISQTHFEVGIDVLEGFYTGAISAAHCESISAAVRPSALHPMKFHADLYALARAELAELGVTQVFGGTRCTFAESDLFYSYRRDGDTGRMASLIWLV